MNYMYCAQRRAIFCSRRSHRSSDLFAPADPADLRTYTSQSFSVLKKENPFPPRGVQGVSPWPKIVFLKSKNICFCAGDAIGPEILRYQEFPAIAPEPKTHKTKTRVLGDSHSPNPAMPQPCPFSKAKAYVSVCTQTPESKPKVQGPGPRPSPKHKTKKHVFPATPTAPIPQCHSPARFLKEKRMFS